MQHEKRCSRCGQIKDLSWFRLRSEAEQRRLKSTLAKYQAWCTDCATKYEREQQRWQRLARKLRKRGATWTAGNLKMQLGPPKTCHLCGGELDWTTSSIDHVLPPSKGGTHNIDNLKWSHFDCNRMKGNKTMQEFQDIMWKILDHLQKCSNS